MIEEDEEELCEEEAHAGDKPQPESTEEAQDLPQAESKSTEEAEDRPKPIRGSNAEYTVVYLTMFVHVCYHKELSLLLP